jgi:hypothetical protein
VIRIAIFNTLYAGTCAYAWIRGSKAERVGVIILIADFQLSHWLVAPLADRYSGVEWPMFAVDGGAMMAFYAMSLVTTRYWPLWMTALQACVTAAHLNGLRHDVVPFAYGHFVALWSYLQLAILAAATIRHRRRLKRYGTDPAWRWHLTETYKNGGVADDTGATTDVKFATST